MDRVVHLPMSIYGHDAILVVVDRFSKMAHFIPCNTDADGPTIAKLLFAHVFKYHGLPKRVITDRDSTWTGQFWAELSRCMGTKMDLGTSHHHETNGQAERLIRLLKETLRHYIDPTQSNWEDLLPAAEFGINNAVNSSTGETPFYINNGYHPRTPLTDVLPSFEPVSDFVKNQTEAIQLAKDCLIRTQDRWRTEANKHRKPISFNVGDKVLLNAKDLPIRTSGAKKLLALYEGFFPIVAKYGDLLYRLAFPDTLRIHPVFHVSLLRPYFARDPKHDTTSGPALPLLREGNEEWELEAIMDHTPKTERKTGRPPPIQNMRFLCRWKGLTRSFDKWIPYRNLGNATRALQEYFDIHKARTGQHILVPLSS